MSDYERYKMYANNADKLANLLETVPDEQHDQKHWVIQGPECGTLCCAMGWATVSGQFEGLEVNSQKNTIRDDVEINGRRYNGITPEGAILNGREASFEEAATHLFGILVTDDVFMRTSTPKQTVINQLRKYADYHCALAKELAPTGSLPPDPTAAHDETETNQGVTNG